MSQTAQNVENKNREYIERYPNGQLAVKENYVNGLLEGSREEWYAPKSLDAKHRKNGQLEIKENYANGILEGLREEWYKRGQLWEKEYYLARNKVSDEEYQNYQENIQIVLNNIIQIKDLAKFVLMFTM